MYLGDIVLNEYFYFLRVKLNHVLYIFFDAVWENVLFISSFLKDQPFEWILQKLKQKYFGWLFRSDIDINAIGKISLEKTDFSLKISQTGQSRLVIQLWQSPHDVIFELIVDQSQYFIDVPCRQNLIFFIITVGRKMIVELFKHFVFKTVVYIFAKWVVSDEGYYDLNIFLLSEFHCFVYDDATQEEIHAFIDLFMEGFF